MNIRIISDESGAAKNVKVLTESGEDIAKHIRKITIHMAVGEIITADIELVHVNVDATALINEEMRIEDVTSLSDAERKYRYSLNKK